MTARDLLLACVMDVLVGDPCWLPHPTRIMGAIVAWYEQRVRRIVRRPAGERAAGLVLALGLPLLASVAGWAAIRLAGQAHELAGTAAIVVLAWTTIAARDLSDHAQAVRRALAAGSLKEAQEAVGLMVGRDTAQLSEPEIVRAAVETVAESASDGVVAPLFYLALGGPPLALAYKAVNTLDSMVGHREPRYLYVGWASARLDDLANWVPARLTAVLLVLAAGFASGSTGPMRRAWLVLRRDGHRHPSPNSGRPEAAMAGALGVQLGGINTYGGLAVERPRLGDPAGPLRPDHLARALQLMWTATGLAIGIVVSVLSWS